MPPNCGTEKSPDLLSNVTGAVALALVSGAEADRPACISTKATLQQTATKSRKRPLRAIADMIERPCFPECRSGWPDPIPGDLRAVLRSSFCCRVYEPISADLIKRCGELILKSRIWPRISYGRRDINATKTRRDGYPKVNRAQHGADYRIIGKFDQRTP